MKRLFPCVIVSALLAASCSQSAEQTPTAGGAEASCMSRAYAEIGGPFSLIDHTGAERTEADYLGKPTLIYFGFTYCPDICPGTLVAIERAYESLPEGVAPPQTLLISVDPERDTPDALASYVSTEAFPDNLVGLTGSEAQIAAAAEQFFVQYERIEQPESLNDYTMDHTSLLYLMNEEWKLQTFFAEGAYRPDEMAECLAQHIS
ncbi:MAG: SCO family protein [Pseudomonadota bacterium]